MKKNFLKIALGVAMIAVVATSCTKDAAAPEPVAKQEVTNNTAPRLAALNVGDTQAGGFTNSSSSPTSWAAVGYDLLNNGTASPAVEVSFEQHFNGNITKQTGYSIGIFNHATITDVTNITLTHVNSTSLTLTTVGSNSVLTPGWYNYAPLTRTITPVAKRYVVVANASTVSAATRVFVVQLDAIAGTGSGPYFTDVDFHVKRLK